MRSLPLVVLFCWHLVICTVQGITLWATRWTKVAEAPPCWPLIIFASTRVHPPSRSMPVRRNSGSVVRRRLRTSGPIRLGSISQRRLPGPSWRCGPVNGCANGCRSIRDRA